VIGQVSQNMPGTDRVTVFVAAAAGASVVLFIAATAMSTPTTAEMATTTAILFI
jgi:hypothetical protein